jgi:hypothetical protein
MYEVGIALACRHPSEVLLARDDEDKFLFDVSSIPHMKIDFTDIPTAFKNLQDALLARFRERQIVYDARVELALQGLSNEETAMLKDIADYPPSSVWGRPTMGMVDFFAMASIPRLLDKQLIQVVGQFEEGHPAYAVTPLGGVVAQVVKTSLRRFKADPKLAPDSEAAPGNATV